MFRTIRFLLYLPFRAFRFSWRLIVLLVLVASLMFNIAIFTVQGLYAAATGMLSAAGITTSVVRETVATRSKQRVRRQIGRETSQRVTRRLKRGAARSIGSAAGEAIPFIGAGVIAGALALEVKDACDTARDMAGLEAALMTEGDPDQAHQAAEDAFDCKAMIRDELPSYDNLPTREGLWATVRASPRRAYEEARKAGVAVVDVDWAGWGSRIGSWAFGWLKSGGSPTLDEPLAEE